MKYKIYHIGGLTRQKVIQELKINDRENVFDSMEEAYEYMKGTREYERMEFTILPYLKSDKERQII
ncbi:MAG TPA: hypothetical protein VN721_05030 [Flavipsychrobacter sp.]|nr:hypothetical protein [Flavipsychrobacter sp.]